MSYKETSERIDEVIGGEVFNPWQFRRFLPAQFERQCKEDPEAICLVEAPWYWVYKNKQLVEELSQSKDSTVKAIAEERARFIPECHMMYFHEDRVVYNAIRKLQKMLLGKCEVTAAQDLPAIVVNDSATEVKAFLEKKFDTMQGDRLTTAGRAIEHLCKAMSDRAEYGEESSLSALISYKELYVKEGIYYYRKSKGENPDLEAVLAMSWGEVVAYRKEVAKSTKDTVYSSMERSRVSKGSERVTSEMSFFGNKNSDSEPEEVKDSVVKSYVKDGFIYFDDILS